MEKKKHGYKYKKVKTALGTLYTLMHYIILLLLWLQWDMVNKKKNTNFDILNMFFFVYIGDISPTTYTEKILGILITIMSCCVFAYAVNTIDVIVREN